MSDHDALPPLLDRSFFDTDEEYQDYLAFETDEEPIQSSDDFKERTATLIAGARIALKDLEGRSTRVTLRIPTQNLEKAKSQALRRGMPYQTYINEIIQKAVRGIS